MANCPELEHVDPKLKMAGSQRLSAFADCYLNHAQSDPSLASIRKTRLR
jgi:hypothetical protein